MRILQEFDRHDYDPALPRHVRRAVRGIIVRDKKLLLVHSDKYGEYKFPGGGVEEGESRTAALIREVREETGLSVLPGSIREYGQTIERRRDRFADGIFEQYSYYYLCDVSEEAGKQQLDAYEEEYGYKPMLAPVDMAIAANDMRIDDPVNIPWTVRELFMLRYLKQHLPGLDTD